MSGLRVSERVGWLVIRICRFSMVQGANVCLMLAQSALGAEAHLEQDLGLLVP